MQYKILMVDDEADLCEIVQFNLENEGYLVETALSAEEALTKDLNGYHLFIFDVMMGRMSGIQLAKEVKNMRGQEDKPIIFLTAKNQETDKLIAFKAGADDYLLKPFSVKELIARIKVILKRSYPEMLNREKDIEFGKIKIIYSGKKASIGTKDMELTKKEFDILHLLASKPGRVFSRDELLNQVWHDDGEINDRTVDVNIRRIRKKLEEYGDCIVTRSGYGYSFEIRE